MNTVVSGSILEFTGGSGSTLLDRVEGMTPPRSLPVHLSTLKLEVTHYCSGWEGVTVTSGTPFGPEEGI